MGFDTSLSGAWTRRDFLRGAAGVVAAPKPQVQSPGFAFVASGKTAIHGYSVSGNRWTLQQTVPSLSPAFVLLDSPGRRLYVANELDDYEGFPRGAVETFAVGSDGTLRLLQRRPLSLSATRPRHMAISPDGKLLAVAAYGGGIYNLLPIERDGTLGPPSGILKETGCGAHAEVQASAHPHTVRFDTSGRSLLASDLGKDQLNVFAVEDGRLVRQSQRSTGAGSGPGAWVVHPGGSLLFALHELEQSLAMYRVTGTAVEQKQQIALTGATGALAVHPSGSKLYTGHADGLRIWTIGRTLLSAQSVPIGTVNYVTTTEDVVYACVAAQGSIYRMGVDRMNGELDTAIRVARITAPGSMALRPL
jgi:6-phosphogluconolactonase